MGQEQFNFGPKKKLEKPNMEFLVRKRACVLQSWVFLVFGWKEDLSRLLSPATSPVTRAVTVLNKIRTTTSSSPLSSYNL